MDTVNPSTIYGGTWEQIKDKFLLSAGDTYANGTTGGEAIHTLTTAEMPSHSHTFTGTEHSHIYKLASSSTGGTAITTAQLPKHTHTYAKVKSPTGGPSNNTSGGPSNNTSGSTTLTINQIPAHSHNFQLMSYTDSNGGSYGGNEGSGVYANTGSAGGGQGHTHTLSNHTHTLSSHTHTTSTESANSGETGSGNTHNHSITLTDTTIKATAGGTNSNTGSGNAHNNMPPYLVVYVWKRIA